MPMVTCFLSNAISPTVSIPLRCLPATFSNGKRATPHQVISLKNGGSNEWWNLILVQHPHTETIHGRGPVLRKNLPYKKTGERYGTFQVCKGNNIVSILEAYEQLNKWINKSNGKYIDIGEENDYSFSKVKSFTKSELIDFEFENDITLPDEYKRFLIDVGAVDIFVSEKTAGIEILLPGSIRSFSKSVFYNFGEDLYPRLLLTTSIPRLGYFGGFLIDENRNDNYGIFYPEIPSEFWIDECEFINFNKWVVNLVKSKSKDI